VVKKYNEIEAKDNMKVGRDDIEENIVPKEKKQLEKLVNIQPKKVKRGLIGRLITGVLGPEGLPGIGSYVNDEIIKPAIKNIIFEAITSAASMAMFGERGGPVRGRGGHHTGGHHAGYRPATNYSNRYSTPPANHQPSERLVSHTPRQSVDEYVLEDRFDAVHVLTTLTEQADMYGNASVADYYDLIGVPTKYTDNNYGWTHENIVRATIMPIRGGYIIKFPPVEVI